MHRTQGSRQTQKPSCTRLLHGSILTLKRERLFVQPFRTGNWNSVTYALTRTVRIRTTLSLRVHGSTRRAGAALLAFTSTTRNVLAANTTPHVSRVMRPGNVRCGTRHRQDYGKKHPFNWPSSANFNKCFLRLK